MKVSLTPLVYSIRTKRVAPVKKVVKEELKHMVPKAATQVRAGRHSTGTERRGFTGEVHLVPFIYAQWTAASFPAPGEQTPSLPCWALGRNAVLWAAA